MINDKERMLLQMEKARTFFNREMVEGYMQGTALSGSAALDKLVALASTTDIVNACLDTAHRVLTKASPEEIEEMLRCRGNKE